MKTCGIIIVSYTSLVAAIHYRHQSAIDTDAHYVHFTHRLLSQFQHYNNNFFFNYYSRWSKAYIHFHSKDSALHLDIELCILVLIGFDKNRFIRKVQLIYYDTDDKLNLHAFFNHTQYRRR